MVGSHKDRIEKQDRVARLLRGAGASILMTSHEAVSWYLEGVRTHVSLAGRRCWQCGRVPTVTRCSSRTTWRIG